MNTDTTNTVGVGVETADVCGADTFQREPQFCPHAGRMACRQGGRLRLSVRRYFVVCDVALTPGTIVHGTPAPAGTVITAWPLCKPLYSRLQFRKALKRLKPRHPGAYGVKIDSVPGERYTPTRIQYPVQANGGAA